MRVYNVKMLIYLCIENNFITLNLYRGMVSVIENEKNSNFKHHFIVIFIFLHM